MHDIAAARLRREEPNLGAPTATPWARHAPHADDLALALDDERSKVDFVLRASVARPKLRAIAEGAVEAGTEQAVPAIGEVAERNLGAMCLR